jgi:Kef-type K+ transport system membrane component KefB/nucleotide-binding universal stress UspA family protein
VAIEHSAAIFLAELILLLLVGRMLGEVLGRFGQPAIFGQLLAGVLLGPSVFGALFPDLWHLIFPGTATIKSMIDAISQIGILLLLLLTGMEANLSLVNRRRRAVISTSVLGIAVPFVCGVALTYALPAALLPHEGARLVTGLFLGTALSISSIKIVAIVLMELGAIRRDLGQLILATAILDDTIAWAIIAVIAGIASHGTVSLTAVGMSLADTAIFIALSLTIGRRVVAWVIRWSNDNMTIEVPVVTAILLVMLVMALTTDLIGVHTALGAFMAGVLIGQSPILTEHIEGELRGFVLAFFSPVFFAVAGLGVDLRTLLEPTTLLITFAIILVATIGKFLGALIGGEIGGLTRMESLALATGLNARGSTEVIIASIGLSTGALNNQLYTMIVAMAVITTMAMPPSLRWVLARVPMREEEQKRLDKEDAQEQEKVPNMERALAYVDGSPNGRGAATLVGLFAGRQQILTTIMETAKAQTEAKDGSSAKHYVMEIVEGVLKRTAKQGQRDTAAPPKNSFEELVLSKAAEADDDLEKEAAKSYSIVFIGIGQPISESAHRFEDRLQRLIETFDGPVVILLNGAKLPEKAISGLNVLVASGGTSEGRLALEIALALAAASGGTLTALHVLDPRDADMLRSRSRRLGPSVLVDAKRLGKRSDLSVKALTAINARPEMEIVRLARTGSYDLLVLGTSLRQAETKFIGPRTAALVRAIRIPVLLVAR